MMPIDPDGESTTTWMLRAEKAEAELAALQAERAVDIRYMDECKAELSDANQIISGLEGLRGKLDAQIADLEAERDRLEKFVANLTSATWREEGKA